MSGTTTPLAPPPILDKPIAMNGDFSQAWTRWQQSMVDQVTRFMATYRRGVTDGSDAVAGDIGEYLEASDSAGLASGAMAGIVDLSLTAGDWDVSGGVLFAAGTGTHTYFACGIDTIDARIEGAFSALVITQVLNTAVQRRNLTAPAVVQVVAQASFTGTVNASATIRARRVR